MIKEEENNWCTYVTNAFTLFKIRIDGQWTLLDSHAIARLG